MRTSKLLLEVRKTGFRWRESCKRLVSSLSSLPLEPGCSQAQERLGWGCIPAPPRRDSAGRRERAAGGARRAWPVSWCHLPAVGELACHLLAAGTRSWPRRQQRPGAQGCGMPLCRPRRRVRKASAQTLHLSRSPPALQPLLHRLFQPRAPSPPALKGFLSTVHPLPQLCQSSRAAPLHPTSLWPPLSQAAPDTLLLPTFRKTQDRDEESKTIIVQSKGQV